MLPPDVPPVPPLPARFLSQNSLDSRTGTVATPPGQQQYATSLRSYASRHQSADDDVDMEDDEDDFERHQRARGRSDEDEEGMFGRMEE